MTDEIYDTDFEDFFFNFSGTRKIPLHLKNNFNTNGKRIEYLLFNSNKTYKFIKILGKGRFGAVYLAQNREKNTEVAIKILVENGGFWISAKDEISLQRKFTKFNLAPIIYEDVCFKNKYDKVIHIIIMEKIECTLESILINLGEFAKNRKERFKNMNQIKNYINLYVNSLLFLFEKMIKYKVTHGDLHTNNVAFQKDKNGNLEIKLIDFGQSTTKFNFLEVDISQLIGDLTFLDGGNYIEKTIASRLLKEMKKEPFKLNHKINGSDTEFDYLRNKYAEMAGFI